MQHRPAISECPPPPPHTHTWLVLVLVLQGSTLDLMRASPHARAVAKEGSSAFSRRNMASRRWWWLETEPLIWRRVLLLWVPLSFLHTLSKLSCLLCIFVLQQLKCFIYKMHKMEKYNCVLIELAKKETMITLIKLAAVLFTSSTCNEAAMERHYFYKVVAQYVCSSISIMLIFFRGIFMYIFTSENKH